MTWLIPSWLFLMFLAYGSFKGHLKASCENNRNIRYRGIDEIIVLTSSILGLLTFLLILYVNSASDKKYRFCLFMPDKLKAAHKSR